MLDYQVLYITLRTQDRVTTEAPELLSQSHCCHLLATLSIFDDPGDLSLKYTSTYLLFQIIDALRACSLESLPCSHGTLHHPFLPGV